MRPAGFWRRSSTTCRAGATTSRRRAASPITALANPLRARGRQRRQPDDVAAKVRANAASPTRWSGDTAAAVPGCAPNPHNGKVGLFGPAPGRPPRLHLCLPEKGRRRLRRSVGGRRGDGQGGAQRQDAGRADMTKDPRLPAARPVRQRRPRAPARAGRSARSRAQEARQNYEFHRYDGPATVFLLAPAALSARAGDGWLGKVFAFFGSTSRSRERPCAHRSSRSRRRRAWLNAGTTGSSPGPWSPTTTPAMPRAT